MPLLIFGFQEQLDSLVRYFLFLQLKKDILWNTRLGFSFKHLFLFVEEANEHSLEFQDLLDTVGKNIKNFINLEIVIDGIKELLKKLGF